MTTTYNRTNHITDNNKNDQAGHSDIPKLTIYFNKTKHKNNQTQSGSN